MNDSVSHLLKQGLAATYWRFYCHIYLSMTDRNQPRCLHINTFSKILFNYQYFRPQKKKKRINNSSFNKANFSLNGNLFKNETNFVIIIKILPLVRPDFNRLISSYTDRNMLVIKQDLYFLLLILCFHSVSLGLKIKTLGQVRTTYIRT